MTMPTWEEIKQKVLEKEPKAAPALAVIEKHWGDGKLTQELAEQFISAWMQGDYVEAKRLLYSSMTAEALIEEDRSENARLKAMIDAETKLYDFAAEFAAVVLKVALGVALAAVGL